MIEASVHFLDFTDNSPTYDRFNVLWQLVDLDKQPMTVSGLSKESVMKSDFRLKEGDLVVFPSLLSGAGEFEGMRFVGQKMKLSAIGDYSFPLLTAGIEFPEFPSLLLQHMDVSSLKEMYEAPFNAVLQQQSSKYNLKDLFSSDDEAYNQFWNEPPVARRRGPSGGDPWSISLSECIWIETLEGKSSRGSFKNTEIDKEEL
mmetsp:Transcript_17593/g.27580  ORF Transcript_17593/g.27580 Transcript_17593/m.27580 type:complete len:201 (+) Transcript_17593:159-761(+)